MKLLLGCFFGLSLFAATPYGDPNAVKGGEIRIGIGSYPKSLLLYLAAEDLVQGINNYVFDPLVVADLKTYEIVPRIAKKWVVSKDKLTYTFTLDSNAKFSDGTPVTSEDVKFTWDAIYNPNHKTAPSQAVFSSFESVKVLDPMTVEFKAKVKCFQNLDVLQDFYVLPKHYFSKGDFNKDFNSKFIGSGPYFLAEAKQGEKIVLKRNPDYWAAKYPQNIGRYNIDTIVYRVHEDETVRYEMFKKGDLDFFQFNMAKMWATETDGPIYEKGYVKKLRGDSLYPSSMSGIIWNLRKPLFQDVRVRQALSHLLDREKMIRELFYNSYEMTTGPMAQKSEYHSPRNKPLLYDPKKAQALLKEAGFTKISEDGVLMKGEQRLEIDLMLNNPAYQRILTGYMEELRKNGIKLNMRMVEWATSLKLREENAFDGFAIAWTREPIPWGFARMWGSKAADLKGSDNHAGYKNPEIDKLAEEIDITFDKKKRVKLIQKLDEIIGRDQPWTFFWELPYFRVAYWNKYSMPKSGAYLPYSIWRNVMDYWWVDPKKEQVLNEKRKTGEKVPF